jgi:hypothetical protein
MTLSIMTLSIMTQSKMTLIIIVLIMTLSTLILVNGSLNRTHFTVMLIAAMQSVVMLSVGMLRGVLLNVIMVCVRMLSIVMLNVTILSGGMLSIVGPSKFTMKAMMLNVIMLSIVAPLIRLYPSPDASTFPSFKLMCFVYIVCFFRKSKMH